MAKVKILNGIPHIWCPACNYPHGIDTRWRYNFNPASPTFKPHVRFRLKGHKRETGEPVDVTCVFLVVQGSITYLPETTHDQKGQTLPLPEWESLGNPVSDPVPVEAAHAP